MGTVEQESSAVVEEAVASRAFTGICKTVRPCTPCLTHVHLEGFMDPVSGVLAYTEHLPVARVCSTQ